MANNDAAAPPTPAVANRRPTLDHWPLLVALDGWFDDGDMGGPAAAAYFDCR